MWGYAVWTLPCRPMTILKVFEPKIDKRSGVLGRAGGEPETGQFKSGGRGGKDQRWEDQ